MNKNTITRSHLSESLSEQTGLARNEAAQFLEEFLGLIGDTLETEGQVKLSRFGFFEVREKGARIGRNPRTKKLATIHARKVVGFRASNLLRQKVEAANPINV